MAPALLMSLFQQHDSVCLPCKDSKEICVLCAAKKVITEDEAGVEIRHIQPSNMAWLAKYSTLGTFRSRHSTFGSSSAHSSNIPAAGKVTGGRRWPPVTLGDHWQMLMDSVWCGVPVGAKIRYGFQRSPLVFTGPPHSRLPVISIGVHRIIVVATGDQW
ncbi:hypothetical protein B0H11DRAFT_1899146 [Mycena galericulata]|nr:hypothetical protein B0H11DRAFT_1899146 [Mycena galericulata]